MLLRNRFPRVSSVDGRPKHRKLGIEPLEDRRMLAQTVGLLVNEPESFEGYTLFSPSVSGTTYLIDHYGERAKTWQSQFPPMSAYLIADPDDSMPGFENGDMIRAARLPDTSQSINAPGGSGRIELFDWQGNLKWFYTMNEVDSKTPDPNDNDGIPDRRLHHDFEVMPNGNILMIAWERFTNAQEVAHGRDPSLSDEVWPDMVIEVKPNFNIRPGENVARGGQIVWQWHLWDHVVQDKYPNRPNYGNIAENPHKIDLNYQSSGLGAGGDPLADWTHFNAIDYNPDLDQIVVSSREFSEFWVIDHSTTTQQAKGSKGGRSGMGGDILYRWGSPHTYDRGTIAQQKMAYQHDAQWIERGMPGEQNFLVFDNGWNRAKRESFSAVHEIVAPDNQQWIFNNDTDGSVDDLIVFGTKPLNYLDDFTNLDNPWSSKWRPVVGDWDNDGEDSGGFYDPQNNKWILSNNTGRATAWNDLVVYDGPGGVGNKWMPIAGNWDGVGGDSVGFYNPNSQTFHLSNANGAFSQDVTITAVEAGINSDWQPIAGDWNNDGKDTVGVRNPHTNDWYLNNDPAGWNAVHHLPAPGVVPMHWQPIAGDWDGDGYDTVGLFNGRENTWYLNNRIDGTWIGNGVDGVVIDRPGSVPDTWMPLAGDWNGDGMDAVGFYRSEFYTKPPGRAFGPVDPVWSYTSKPKSDFFATIISGAHRLPNGNTIIDEGTEGRFFEVTPEGKIVWEYINPFSFQANSPPPRMLNYNEPVNEMDIGIRGVYGNFTFRAYRYGTDYIPQFNTVTSKGPLEQYPDYYDTPGLYDPINEDWYLNNHNNNTLTDVERFNVGGNNPENWVPVAGDWNGNGKDGVGLYDPTNYVFHLNNKVDGSLDQYFRIDVNQAGVTSTWQPIAGDWNNNGKDTVGLRDPLGNDWYLNNNTTQWRNPTVINRPGSTPVDWIPIAGDWDGDGYDTLGLYDPTNNDWYLNNRRDGRWVDNGVDAIVINRPARPAPNNWAPLAGDFNGNGRDSIGVYDPDSGKWRLNNRINGSVDDVIVIRDHGQPPTWLPIIGDWDGTG